ncbi:hypothetical protein HDU79_000375 [Rhizoclosmatium sp. JEL0117]|nr:hypothetical protein HDU79_000375 [Rhizoclosmatium sp. JEL0117]
MPPKATNKTVSPSSKAKLAREKAEAQLKKAKEVQDKLRVKEQKRMEKERLEKEKEERKRIKDVAKVSKDLADAAKARTVWKEADRVNAVAMKKEAKEMHLQISASVVGFTPEGRYIRDFFETDANRERHNLLHMTGEQIESQLSNLTTVYKKVHDLCLATGGGGLLDQLSRHNLSAALYEAIGELYKDHAAVNVGPARESGEIHLENDEIIADNGIKVDDSFDSDTLEMDDGGNSQSDAEYSPRKLQQRQNLRFKDTATVSSIIASAAEVFDFPNLPPLSTLYSGPSSTISSASSLNLPAPRVQSTADQATMKSVSKSSSKRPPFEEPKPATKKAKLAAADSRMADMQAQLVDQSSSADAMMRQMMMNNMLQAQQQQQQDREDRLERQQQQQNMYMAFGAIIPGLLSFFNNGRNNAQADFNGTTPFRMSRNADHGRQNGDDGSGLNDYYSGSFNGGQRNSANSRSNNTSGNDFDFDGGNGFGYNQHGRGTAFATRRGSESAGGLETMRFSSSGAGDVGSSVADCQDGSVVSNGLNSENPFNVDE